MGKNVPRRRGDGPRGKSPSLESLPRSPQTRGWTEWDKEGEFKGTEERKVRTRVEARCIEPDTLLQHFDKLIKGLSTSLTAIQTSINAEKSLMSNRENQ